MLLERSVGTWWQGVKNTITTWDKAKNELRATYAKKRSNDQLYLQLFSTPQEEGTMTDRFICDKRSLLAQFRPIHDEATQLDMVYALMIQRVKKHIRRNAVTTFKELIDESRTVEATILTH